MNLPPLQFQSRMTSLQAVNSHLLPVVESLWVLRVVPGLTLHRGCSVALREVKAGMDTVDIQNQLASI